MPAALVSRPRKRPQQARSRATVAALREATAQVLINRGYSGMTTDEVARVAGVSIGSLYQYFPNKNALVAAVLEHELDEMMRQIESELANSSPGSLRDRVLAVINALIHAKRRRPKLNIVLKTELPRVGAFHLVDEVNARSVKLIKHAMLTYSGELRPVDLELAAFVMVHAVDGVVDAVLSKMPQLLTEPKLPDELVELCVRYLEGGRRGPSSAGRRKQTE